MEPEAVALAALGGTGGARQQGAEQQSVFEVGSRGPPSSCSGSGVALVACDKGKEKSCIGHAQVAPRFVAELCCLVEMRLLWLLHVPMLCFLRALQKILPAGLACGNLLHS